jgi:3-oxoacyl-[acyl-carrier-protein] synthase II
MEAFIRATGNISPQPTFDNLTFLEEIREYNSARLQSVDPEYKQFIQPMQLRRMSRLLKMGVTSARICLDEAGVQKPDAIITGTGLGMMEETEKFLNNILDTEEGLLNPTPFIQSTHNTVGASIAVMVGCNNYNLTYVHGPVSFENALLDSLMLLDEKPSDKILLGGIEEITNDHFAITDSMGFWKKGEISNLDILKDKNPGTIAGEGAAFFLLTREPDQQNYAKISGLATRFNPCLKPQATIFMEEFLSSQGMKKTDIDLVILGMNGDLENDAIYQPVREYFQDKQQAWYKHLCGEHYLASSFALWLGAKIMKFRTVPGVVRLNELKNQGEVKNILLYNHYKNLHHSFVLLTSC